MINKKDIRLGMMGGCGSSGTTLLIHLLSRSKHICSGPEFNCFNHRELYDFPSLKSNLKTMYDGKCLPNGYVDIGVFMTYRQEYAIDLEIVRKWIARSNNSETFIKHITQHMTDRFNVPYFIEKSPSNVYCFDIISKSFPHYHLIHVIRDGRDVVSSLMKRGFNLFGAGSRWLYDTLSGLQARGSQNYIEIRYERLVSDPPGTLYSIFDRLEIPFDSENIFSEDTDTPGVYTENWKNRKEPQVWQQTPGDPISSSSVGRYKKDLEPYELDLLYRIKLSKKSSSNLGQGITSFKDLIEFLDFDLAEDTDTIDSIYRSGNRLKKFNLQAEDYIRRWKRFHERYFWRIPPVLTYLD